MTAEPDNAPAEGAPSNLATLGAGCFWCVEAVFLRLPGVKSVTSGYAGGYLDNPTYEQVKMGMTGHAEVIQVEFDPEQISYAQLLDTFWRAHDPTTLNRQGADIGTQYRSIIFYHDEQQREIAEASREKAAGLFRNPIVTEIEAMETFYPAEDYHQDFFRNNPGNAYCAFTIPPKLKKLGLDQGE